MVWLKWPPGSCLLGVLEFMLHFNSVIFLLSNALMLVGVFFLLFFFSFLFFSETSSVCQHSLINISHVFPIKAMMCLAILLLLPF